MPLQNPFNLDNWLSDNKDLLKPPVGNKNLYTDSKDYIVMIVGGPNARKDFHYNETEELFYQLKGDIQILIQEDKNKKKIIVSEGSMYLLPAKVPHSPIRPKNSIGLVFERKREATHKDGLLWYCNTCNHKLHDTYFPLKDIEKDFSSRVNNFFNSIELRTCKNCGEVMPADPRFIS